MGPKKKGKGKKGKVKKKKPDPGWAKTIQWGTWSRPYESMPSAAVSAAFAAIRVEFLAAVKELDMIWSKTLTEEFITELLSIPRPNLEFFCIRGAYILKRFVLSPHDTFPGLKRLDIGCMDELEFILIQCNSLEWLSLSRSEALKKCIVEAQNLQTLVVDHCLKLESLVVCSNMLTEITGLHDSTRLQVLFLTCPALVNYERPLLYVAEKPKVVHPTLLQLRKWEDKQEDKPEQEFGLLPKDLVVDDDSLKDDIVVFLAVHRPKVDRAPAATISAVSLLWLRWASSTHHSPFPSLPLVGISPHTSQHTPRLGSPHCTPHCTTASATDTGSEQRVSEGEHHVGRRGQGLDGGHVRGSGATAGGPPVRHHQSEAAIATRAVARPTAQVQWRHGRCQADARRRGSQGALQRHGRPARHCRRLQRRLVHRPWPDGGSSSRFPWRSSLCLAANDRRSWSGSGMLNGGVSNGAGQVSPASSECSCHHHRRGSASPGRSRSCSSSSNRSRSRSSSEGRSSAVQRPLRRGPPCPALRRWSAGIVQGTHSHSHAGSAWQRRHVRCLRSHQTVPRWRSGYIETRPRFTALCRRCCRGDVLGVRLSYRRDQECDSGG